jgi:hypothetical protein
MGGGGVPGNREGKQETGEGEPKGLERIREQAGNKRTFSMVDMITKKRKNGQV